MSCSNSPFTHSRALAFVSKPLGTFWISLVGFLYLTTNESPPSALNLLAVNSPWCDLGRSNSVSLLRWALVNPAGIYNICVTRLRIITSIEAISSCVFMTSRVTRHAAQVVLTRMFQGLTRVSVCLSPWHHSDISITFKVPWRDQSTSFQAGCCISYTKDNLKFQDSLATHRKGSLHGGSSWRGILLKALSGPCSIRKAIILSESVSETCVAPSTSISCMSTSLLMCELSIKRLHNVSKKPSQAST